MIKRVIGLDIGTSAVRAVQLGVGGGRPLLLGFGQVSLPRGAVVDGEVADQATVASAIRRLSREGGFHQRMVNVGITGLRAITRELEMPYVPDNEVDDAVRFQANEMIPFPAEQTLLSAQILEDFEGPEGAPMRRVVVSAAHQDLVTSVVSAVVAGGLTPANVDLASSAIVRAVVPPQSSAEPEAIVSVGAGMTIVAVHRENHLDFVRTIGQGGNAVTDAISSTLGMPPTDAEALKRRIGEPFPELAPVEAATREPIGELVSEIRNSLDYFAALPGRDRVSRVFLTGGGAQLPGLWNRLAGQLDAQLVAADPLGGLDLSRIDLDDSDVAAMNPVLATPVGTAIPAPGRPRDRVNLMPPEALSRMQARRVNRRLAAIAAAVIGLMAVVYGARAVQTRSTQHDVDTAKHEVAVLNAQITRYDDVVQTRQRIKQAEGWIAAAVAREVSWPTVLDQLSRNIPDNVVLTNFAGTTTPAQATAQTGTGTAPGKPGAAATATTASLPSPSALLGTINVGASGPVFGGGAEWITQMDGSPAFANTFISSITQAPQSSGDAVTFSSVLNITGAAHSTRLSEYLREPQ